MTWMQATAAKKTIIIFINPVSPIFADEIRSAESGIMIEVIPAPGYSPLWGGLREGGTTCRAAVAALRAFPSKTDTF